MKMEKNILPFIELEDIASLDYPVYAHMKEKDCITIYETLEAVSYTHLRAHET